MHCRMPLSKLICEVTNSALYLWTKKQSASENESCRKASLYPLQLIGRRDIRLLRFACQGEDFFGTDAV